MQGNTKGIFKSLEEISDKEKENRGGLKRCIQSWVSRHTHKVIPHNHLLVNHSDNKQKVHSQCDTVRNWMRSIQEEMKK
jgi:hypothetical protein